MSELKPCPFCGGGAIKWTHSGYGDFTKQVRCAVCGAGTNYFSKMDDAIKAWNRRKEEQT